MLPSRSAASVPRSRAARYRGVRLGEGRYDDVVVEAVEPARILRGVDEPDRTLDAELLQVAQIRLHDPLEQRRHEQELDRHGLAGLHIGELAVLDLPAGLFQQHHRLAQVPAHVGLLVVRGIFVNLGEYLSRHLIPDAVQNLEFPARGQFARRGQLAILEIAADPFILAIEQILVGPFEVESEIERLAHAAVLKLRTPQVEHEGLHGLRALDLHLLALDVAIAHGGEVIARRPVFRARFLPVVEITRLEALERHGRVAVIVEADLVVIPLALVHRQILAPIVGHPLINDRTAGRGFLEPIGPEPSGGSSVVFIGSRGSPFASVPVQ